MFYSTVWTFNNFSATRILCEINFRDSRSEKSALFCNFEGLNVSKNQNSESLKLQKWPFLNFENLYN